MKMELTVEELDILIDSLKSWINRDVTGELISGLFGSLIIKDKDKLKEFELEQKKKKDDLLIQKKIDEENANLITSKLILLKREIVSKKDL